MTTPESAACSVWETELTAGPRSTSLVAKQLSCIPTFELEGQQLLVVLLQVAQHLRQAVIELVWAEGEGQLGPGQIPWALPGCKNRQEAACWESAVSYRPVHVFADDRAGPWGSARLHQAMRDCAGIAAISGNAVPDESSSSAEWRVLAAWGSATLQQQLQERNQQLMDSTGHSPDSKLDAEPRCQQS